MNAIIQHPKGKTTDNKALCGKLQKEIELEKEDTYGALINKRGRSNERVVGGRWERRGERETAIYESVGHSQGRSR